MAVTAHPDDEAGNFGGTLRLYSDRGVETSVICLTLGQAASNRGLAKSDRDLAEIRRAEFAASCQILGVCEPVILDYPDGQLHRQELNRVVYELTRHIRKFRPEVLLTYGGDGGVTGHSDHSMAGIFATMAFHWAGRGNCYADQLENGVTAHRVKKLYYSTAEFPLPNRPAITFAPTTTVIDIGEYLETKIAAFKAHKSQSPLWTLFEENARKAGRRELFHLAAWTDVAFSRAETDLLAGINKS